MTIEEEFFKTFGLKPYYLYYVVDLQGRRREYCFKKEEFIDFVKRDKRYLLLKVEKRTPEITSDKLLELICIGQNYFDFDFKNLYFENQNKLKNEILKQLKNYKNQKFSENKFKEQVRKLFEE